MAAIDDDSVDEAVYSLYGLVVTDGSISVMNKAEGAFYSDQLRTLSDVKACRAALAVLRQSIDDAAADVRKLRAALTDERIDARVGRVASAMVAMQEGMHLVYACKIALNAGERTIVFTQAECDRLLQLWQTFWDAMLARPLMHRFRHQEPESPPTYSDSFTAAQHLWRHRAVRYARARRAAQSIRPVEPRMVPRAALARDSADGQVCSRDVRAGRGGH